MNEKEFNELVDKKKYQVLLFSCPCSLPISFAAHTWIVVNNKGVIKRYAGSWLKYGDGKYISKDPRPPYKGLRVVSFFKWPHWNSKLICIIEGNNAKEISSFIENNIRKYPFLNKYHFYPGPNSNTFIQWIIDKFPDSGFKLPWNAFGKNYGY